MVYLIQNLSTVGGDSMVLAFRLSSVMLSITLLHSREWACNNGLLTIISANLKAEATASLVTLCICFGHSG
jgi:hypothetical protein